MPSTAALRCGGHERRPHIPERFGQDGPGIPLDLSALANAIFGAFSSATNLGLIGNTIWQDFGNWFMGGIKGFYLGLWQAAMFDIPHNLTDNFGPVSLALHSSGPIAVAGLVLSMTLMGLRVILSGAFGFNARADVAIGRIIVAASSISLLPWLVSHAIDLEQAYARSVALADVVNAMPNLINAIDLSTFLAFLFMAWYGIKLWFKLAANIVKIAVAIFWAPVAISTWFVPESSWIASAWIHEFVGRLMGAALAVIASAIGLTLAFTHPGFVSIAFIGAAFMAAADYIDWLARSPGSSMGGALGAGMRLGAGVAMRMGGPAAAAAIPANQLTTRAEMYGFD